MSQSEAERAVLQAMHGDGALTPYGSAKVQINGRGTAYLAVPVELAEHYGMTQGVEVQRGFHAETGCLVACLHNDVDLFER
ncbi:hypothetical protein [Salinirussus salinus]|uniref:hypothetical protein n=1 Tax=Salinirussus salinus TaxID=1198300 RepID=UPI00135AC887|nr:hypothetical protein [Salinirussus salinus]